MCSSLCIKVYIWDLKRYRIIQENPNIFCNISAHLTESHMNWLLSVHQLSAFRFSTSLKLQGQWSWNCMNNPRNGVYVFQSDFEHGCNGSHIENIIFTHYSAISTHVLLLNLMLQICGLWNDIVHFMGLILIFYPALTFSSCVPPFIWCYL